MIDTRFQRIMKAIVATMITLAAVAACVQAPTSAAAVPSSPPLPAVLIWYRIDPMLETACTAWGDRLYRAQSGPGESWSITVAPSTSEDYPCGLRSQNDPNYGPGANS